MAALDLQDGLTLDGATASDFGGLKRLAVVSYKYRPALWHECVAVRHAEGTTRYAAEVSKLLAAHVVSWDVTMGGHPAPVTEKTLALVSEPILAQILNTVLGWAQTDQDSLGK